MRKTWIIVLAVPLAIAGVAGPASAEKGPKTKPVPNEHVTITFAISNPQSAGTVVATGPIAGTGTASAATKGRHIGRVRIAVETLTFGADTVKVRALSSHGKRTLDAATCTTTEKGKGAFQIKGGTGAYAKAKGRGHFTSTATVVGTKDASSPKGCSFKTPTGTLVIDATATVKL